MFNLMKQLEVLMLMEKKFLFIVHQMPREIQGNTYPYEKEDEIKDDFIT